MSNLPNESGESIDKDHIIEELYLVIQNQNKDLEILHKQNQELLEASRQSHHMLQTFLKKSWDINQEIIDKELKSDYYENKTKTEKERNI